MKWQPIETHPLTEDDCILAILDGNGDIYVADRGGWTPGRTIEEWDEVEDGIKVKIWEEEEEGSWWSNHCVIDEPTHWAPLSAAAT